MERKDEKPAPRVREAMDFDSRCAVPTSRCMSGVKDGKERTSLRDFIVTEQKTPVGKKARERMLTWQKWEMSSGA
jgi:hypothetical protein